jgi:cytochrome b561
MVRSGLDRTLQDALFIYHKNVGVCLWVLLLVRLVVRLRNPSPPRVTPLPAWQERVAQTTHRALYLLLFLLPVSGYIRVRAGGFPIEALDALGLPGLVPRSDELAEVAKAVHYWTGVVLMACLSLHVSAALFHAIVKRDGVFSRMWPPLGGRSG